MKKLKLGKLTIGGPKAIVIAEIADSHNGRLEGAYDLIDAAKEAGADVVKFQLHLPDVEMVPDSIDMWDGPLYDILKRNLFTPEMHKEVMKYCNKIDIEYLCTPFCPASVDVLDKLGVKAFKTGSGEVTNLPQHRKLAKIAKKREVPVIVSTGMSKWEEIRDTVKVYEEEGAKDYLVLMNCTSEYPANNPKNARLGLIKKMQDEFGIWVGQSSHTMENYLEFGAVALGAKIIEKHFTISRKQRGPDHGIALEPHMMADLVRGVRQVEQALSDKKNISKDEQTVRDWAFHSVTISKAVKKGEKLTLKNLMPRRPGSGIPSKYLDPLYSKELIGKVAKKNLSKDTILQWKDVG